MIVVLSGGVGAARLLRSLRGVIAPEEVLAIVNVGDDLELHGLSICPDLDTITYTLAGLNNEELGWGLTGESWRVMDELRKLGGEAWFALGDRDLATHLYRTQRLRDGATKAQVTRELATKWGVRESILPVTNDLVQTRFDTEVGPLSFQEYFVAHHHNVKVRTISFDGIELATAAPGVLEALDSATRIIIAPSNPLISIEPILGVRGVRERLLARRDDVIAVSPLIEGAALKGPADRLMDELGLESSCVGVARYYREIAGQFILDERDAARADEVRALGVTARVTTTVMSNPLHARQLAMEVLT